MNGKLIYLHSVQDIIDFYATPGIFKLLFVCYLLLIPLLTKCFEWGTRMNTLNWQDEVTNHRILLWWRNHSDSILMMLRHFMEVWDTFNLHSKIMLDVRRSWKCLGITAFPGEGGEVFSLRNKRLYRQFQPKEKWFDYEDQVGMREEGGDWE